MRRLFFALMFLALSVTSLTTSNAQSPQAATDIRAMMQKSVDDWNRGDLDAFATSYKNSPDILFIGRKISHGYAQMLVTYKRGYPTREKMGTLAFSNLDIQPLDAHFATLTGNFQLVRTAAGGGNANGHFLLVVELTPEGWKIVRDDTDDDTVK